MGIRRTPLKFESKYTQVPNAWVRDERLTRRARGLLTELLSHRVGWHVSIASLQKSGPEGRDAVRSAVAELVGTGYLRLSQSRGDHGRFNEIEYELNDPFTGVGSSDTGGFTDSGSTDSGSTDSGSTDSGETDTKNNSSSEDQPSEPQTKNSYTSEFEEFWMVYPRHEGKADAFKAYEAALKVVPHDVLLKGAQKYKLASLGGDPQFVKLGAGWLRGRRWEDEPTIATTAKPDRDWWLKPEAAHPSPTERATATLALAGNRPPTTGECPHFYVHSSRCDECGLYIEGAIA